MSTRRSAFHAWSTWMRERGRERGPQPPSRGRGAPWLAFMVLAGATAWLGACGDKSSPAVDSQTHWLVSCERNADCGELLCTCGFCVAPCKSDGSCSVAGKTTSCTDSSAAGVVELCNGNVPAIDVCLEACTRDSQCGSATRCVSGTCIPRAVDGAADAGGVGGGDGGSCIGVGEGCGDNGPACCKGTCPIEGCTNSIPGSCFGTCPVDSATSWNPTCGDPSCGPPTMGTCTTQVAGATCDTPGSACETGECGVALVCTTEAEAPDLSFCPRSRARFKRDIEYVSETERTLLARELLQVPLAKYVYRDDPGGRTHLGFIIEDVEPSPMADSARDRVDLYGYLSMAVAALQSQQAELEALRGEVEQLQHANEAALVCEP